MLLLKSADPWLRSTSTSQLVIHPGATQPEELMFTSQSASQLGSTRPEELLLSLLLQGREASCRLGWCAIDLHLGWLVLGTLDDSR